MNEQTPSLEFWNEWRQSAIAAGVAEPLADLGSDVLRLHRKNRWSKDFLGVEDDGPFMLEMCLAEPAQAEMLFLENLHPYDTDLLAAARIRLGVA